jgi:hypothetical protein
LLGRERMASQMVKMTSDGNCGVRQEHQIVKQEVAREWNGSKETD